MMKFSKTTNGFYTTELHGSDIPLDAVDITVEQYQTLLTGQAAGRQISADETGHPVLTDPPALSQFDQTLQHISALEGTITPRRIRESILGTDNGWLADIDRQIKELRKGL